MSNFINKSPIISALLVFISFLLFYSAGLAFRDITTRGEGREALVIRAMIEQNNYILPLRNGEDIPSKPIMFHWLGAASAKIFGGVSEFSVRFPSALCASLVITLLFIILRKSQDIWSAIFGVLLLATAFEWNRTATFARVDMCFVWWFCFTSVCLYLLIETVKNQAPILKRTLLVLISGASLSAAVLSKGPAGSLPLIVGGVYLCIVYWRKWLTRDFFLGLFFLAIVLLIAGVISCYWYYAAYQIHGEKFLYVQIFKENVARFFDVETEDMGHKHAFYVAFLYLFVGLLPICLLIPFFKRNQLKIINRDEFIFAVCLLTTVFLIVAFSSNKRQVYLLPIYPAVVYIISFFNFADKVKKLVKTLTCILVCVYFVGNTFILGKVFEKNSPKDFAKIVHEKVGNDRLYQYLGDYFAFVYYYGENVPRLLELDNDQSTKYILIAEHIFDKWKMENPKKTINLEQIAISDTKAADTKSKLILFKFTPL